MLAAVLLLSLMPAVALAEGESGGSAQEVQPLYWRLHGTGNELTSEPLSLNAASVAQLDFYLDAEGNTALPVDAIFQMDAKLGGIEWLDNPNWDPLLKRWQWFGQAAIPGASGIASVAVAGVQYGVEMHIGRAPCGMYTVPTINENDPGENYVPASKQNSSYTVTYTATERSVYLITSSGAPIDVSAVTVSEELAYDFDEETGVLELTLKDGYTETVEANVSVGIVPPLTIRFVPAPPALPEGYAQLYVDGVASFTAAAGDGNALRNLSVDGKIFNLAAYDFSVSDSELGMLSLNGDGDLFLAAQSATPGTSGWIYAVSKTNANEKYALYVKIGQPYFGVYTSSTLDPNDLGKNYIPRSQQNLSLSVTYSDTERSVYLHPVEGAVLQAETLRYPSDLLDYTQDPNTGVLCFTLKAGVSGAVSTIITFTGQKVGYWTRQFSFPINFTPAPPAGYGQLYMNDGAVSMISAPAANGYFLNKPYANGAELKIREYDFSVSDSKLGTISVNNTMASASLNTTWATPGASGLLYAVSKSDPSVKYAIAVSIGKPFVGAYTRAAIDESDWTKDYIYPDANNGNKYTVDYTETGRSFYLIPSILVLSEANISVDTDKVTAKYENGTLKISLAENCTDAKVTANIAFTLYSLNGNGQPTNPHGLCK